MNWHCLTDFFQQTRLILMVHHRHFFLSQPRFILWQIIKFAFFVSSWLISADKKFVLWVVFSEELTSLLTQLRESDPNLLTVGSQTTVNSLISGQHGWNKQMYNTRDDVTTESRDVCLDHWLVTCHAIIDISHLKIFNFVLQTWVCWSVMSGFIWPYRYIDR